ncbi:MAG: ABC transporter permease [Desulfobacteraceae bacterium]|jgi:putative ABC transport system permease protein
MLSNFIKVTLRKLYREKLYTIINVSGLAFGIACCLILGLFLHNELTYDQHHMNYKRIYRVACEYTSDNRPTKCASVSAALASILKNENTEIIDYVRFALMILPNDPGPGMAIYSDNDTFFWKDIYAVDDNVFEVFTYDIIYGDPETALIDPNSVAVSETFARKYFGDENPIGKTVRSDDATMKISLVFADLPDNTHLKTDVLMSHNLPGLKLDPSNFKQFLWSPGDYTYLVLPENYPQASFKRMTDAFYQRYMKEFGDGHNIRWDAWLQPLKDIHYGEVLVYDRPVGNASFLYGSAMIGLLILLIACINYMNLATARSLKRGREVGFHKVLGAKKPQLIMQFLGETIIISFMALFLGLIIVELVLILTPVNEMTGNLQLTDYLAEPVRLLWLIGLTIFTGVVSGAYPAFYLSSISPIAALSALRKAATAQFKMRQILVLIQLVISIGVIASTFLMVLQLRYITNKPLGFARENRVVSRLQGADILEKHKIIKMELLKNPNVLGMTLGSTIPCTDVSTSMGATENNDGIMEPQTKKFIFAFNDDYLDVMGLKLLEGRNFSDQISSDRDEAVIVNETLVKKMDWDEPLGKRIEYYGTRKVIGIVKDFHIQSMHSTVEPFMLVRFDPPYAGMDEFARAIYNGIMVVHISGEGIPKTLDYIRSVMEALDPKHGFEYEFLNEIIDQLYVSENQMVKLTGLFACICVFISCLGLFGLSAFITEQRTREIGVRKVLGASSTQIIFMLSGPSLILVLIASVIASTSTYLVMGEWLSGFAYRTGINPMAFVIAAAMVTIVAFITIALQSYKTAQANPVKALRYE